jgi:hypothetical protein
MSHDDPALGGPEARMLASVDLSPAPQPLPADRHPVHVYLAHLTAAGSRRTMRAALETAAALLSGGRADAETLPWWALHYAHLSALRAKLVERSYAPATGNRILAAVRGAQGVLAPGADAPRAAGPRLRQPRHPGEPPPQGPPPH